MGWLQSVLAIALLQASALAQDFVINYTACPKLKKGCCERVADEARRACQEYTGMFPELASRSSCQVWYDSMMVACQTECGNCTRLRDAIMGQCVFTFQPLRNSEVVTRYCRKSAEAFEKARCPPACTTTFDDCQSREKKDCERECGNYQNCYCAQPRGSMEGEMLSGRRCAGNTVKVDTLGKCDSMPQDCSHHWKPNKCSRYKWCPLDMCVVKKVVCKTDNMCKDISFCNPSNGFCSFTSRPDGSQCDDKLYYTNNDTCQNGVCKGVVDLCKKYNISCVNAGECAEGTGFCIPQNGRCVYDKKNDGVACDDNRKYTIDDKCLGGMCQGREVDLCQDVDCFSQDPCQRTGHCEAKVGKCIPEFVPNVPPVKCDDNDDSTVNDHCIDGICVGERFRSSKFKMLGAGLCLDAKDKTMSHYFGDVAHERECQLTCAKDSQCAAYAYSFPVCRVYGTVRLSAPSHKWGYLPGHDPPPLRVEKSSGRDPGGRNYICLVKAGEGNILFETPADHVQTKYVFSPYVMAGVMMMITVLFFAHTLYKRWHREDDRIAVIKKIPYLKSGDDWSRSSTVMHAWPPQKKRAAGFGGHGPLAGLNFKKFGESKSFGDKKEPAAQPHTATQPQLEDKQESQEEWPAGEGKHHNDGAVIECPPGEQGQVLPGQIPDAPDPAASSSSQ